MVWGGALLGEELHWSLLAGLVFILGGVFLVSRKSAGAGGKKDQPVADERSRTGTGDGAVLNHKFEVTGK
ncbi:DMT family transporter [Paenibacillus sp. P25]|nr:DMT family transporter [Paenibacillus sp. P25]